MQASPLLALTLPLTLALAVTLTLPLTLVLTQTQRHTSHTYAPPHADGARCRTRLQLLGTQPRALLRRIFASAFDPSSYAHIDIPNFSH